MNLRDKTLSIKEAKEMDLVDYLSTLGDKPGKVSNNDYWYLSDLTRSHRCNLPFASIKTTGLFPGFGN